MEGAHENTVAIIGSAEITDWEIYRAADPILIRHEFGATSARKLRDGQNRIILFPRGHEGHKRADFIDHRANLAACRESCVTAIIATCMVGSLCVDLHPGAIIVPDQLIDFHRRIPTTFATTSGYQQLDVTNPYSVRVRNALLVGATRKEIMIDRTTGTYVGMDGPRFETAAESRFLQSAGGTVVGMTSVPEALMALELNIDLGMLAVVVNFAAGLPTADLTSQTMCRNRAAAIKDVESTVMAACRELNA